MFSQKLLWAPRELLPPRLPPCDCKPSTEQRFAQAALALPTKVALPLLLPGWTLATCCRHPARATKQEVTE